MPGAKQHLLFALVLVVIIGFVLEHFAILSSSGRALMIVPMIVYALLPDIDIRTSKIFFYWSILFVLAIVSFLVHVYVAEKVNTQAFIGAALLSLAYLATLFLRHRGIMHKYSTGAFVSLPVWLLVGTHAGVAAIVAYWSHLILDRVRPDE